MAVNIVLYAYAIIGHTRADQLLPQLLMEQFDTFPIQCRHIEHMHEGVWFIAFCSKFLKLDSKVKILTWHLCTWPCLKENNSQNLSLCLCSEWQHPSM